MAKTFDPEEVLGDWCDRDLSAAVQASEIAPAFEVDDLVEELSGLFEAGHSFLLVGAAGIGKTAILHEVVRRSIAKGTTKRFVQVSLRHRASSLTNPATAMGPAMQKLSQALVELGPSVVPVIRDFDHVYPFGLEPQILALLYRFPGCMMAEGHSEVLDAMLETSGELEQRVIVVSLAEPSLARVGRMLEHWNESQGDAFTTPALEQALTVTHRFLARTRLPRKVFDFLTPLLSLRRDGRPITEADVIERFSATQRVPRQLVDPAMPLELTKLEAEFHEKVLGQEDAIKTIVKTIGMIKAGLSDVRRPFGVFFSSAPQASARRTSLGFSRNTSLEAMSGCSASTWQTTRTNIRRSRSLATPMATASTCAAF